MNASLHNLRHSVDKPRLDSMHARSTAVPRPGEQCQFREAIAHAASRNRSRRTDILLMARSLTIPSTPRGTEWEKGEEVSVWLYRSTSKL